jgi:hypothetical protein
VRNETFRFLQKQPRIDRLCEALRASGFELTERSELSLRFARGDAKSVEITWQLAWWPDGDVQVDDRITIRQGSDMLGEIDVSELLRSKLERPLAEEIIRIVVQACAGTSGAALRTIEPLD